MDGLVDGERREEKKRKGGRKIIFLQTYEGLVPLLF